MTSTSISNVTYDLSPDASDALDAFLRDLITTVHSATPCDKDVVGDAVRQLYQAANLDPPAIIWCDSPVQLPVMPLVLQAALFHDRKQLIERFLGTELFSTLAAQLNANDNKAQWSNSRRLMDSKRSQSLHERVLSRIVLLERFNRVFAASVQNRLAISYALSVVSQAHTDINNRLTSALRNELNPCTEVLLGRIAEELGNLLELEGRFGWRLDQEQGGFIRSFLRELPFNTRSLQVHAHKDKVPWLDRGWLFEDPQSPVVETPEQVELLPVARDALIDYFSTWCGWPSLRILARLEFANRFLNPGRLRKQDESMLRMWWHLATGSPAYLCQDSVCFISERPAKLEVDGQNRWHHDSQAAVKFRDQFSIYAWHGVSVPGDLIEHPEKITVERIEQEENAEIRRVMMERYGLSKYILDSGAQIIHQDQYGTLFRKDHRVDQDDFDDGIKVRNTRRTRRMRQDENINALVMVRLINSSPEEDGTFKEYFLRVPPNMKTARPQGSPHFVNEF